MVKIKNNYRLGMPVREPFGNPFCTISSSSCLFCCCLKSKSGIVSSSSKAEREPMCWVNRWLCELLILTAGRAVCNKAIARPKGCSLANSSMWLCNKGLMARRWFIRSINGLVFFSSILPSVVLIFFFSTVFSGFSKFGLQNLTTQLRPELHKTLLII